MYYFGTKLISHSLNGDVPCPNLVEELGQSTVSSLEGCLSPDDEAFGGGSC